MKKCDFIKTYDDLKRTKIGERIQMRREELGFSLRDAADALGISVAELAAYEYGAREIYSDTLLKLCRVYKIDADYIISDNDEISAREVIAAAGI